MVCLNRAYASILLMASVQASTFLRFFADLHREPPVRKNIARSVDVAEHWITQKLDNFDPTNPHTFQMRYYKNDRYFKSGGPIFLVAGGEWTISPGHILPGQHIVDMAKEFNGLLLYSEHRYYGKTRPTNSTSTADLRYLSVDQALADLAHFINAIKSDSKLNATGGVIAVGGSYGGTMVTWLRQKYPHVVTGAWASSAPLRAKIDFSEYCETVGDSIRIIGGEECHQKVKSNFAALGKLFSSRDIDRLRKLFNVCDDFDINDQFDVWNFQRVISSIFSNIVQNHPNSGRLKDVCMEVLAKPASGTDSDTDDLHTFAQFVRRRSGMAECNSFSFNATVEAFKNSDWDGTVSRVNIRQWIYQTCSEFGWYQTSASPDQPFGSSFPVDLNVQMCHNVYGTDFTNATMNSHVFRKNSLYGSLQPAVTNVFFTHGSVDPWHRMGILTDLNSQSPSAVIPGASHCNDLVAINDEKDSKEMLRAKSTIRKLVKSWLNL